MRDKVNLNRSWPSGTECTHPVSKAIWSDLLSHNPDVVFDLHSSKGIYSDAEDGIPSAVGQAVFPTPVCRGTAESVTAAFNEDVMAATEYPAYYDFDLGNNQTGANPLLSHKVGGDLDIPGFLIESTRAGTSVEERAEWVSGLSQRLMEAVGFSFVSASR